MLGRDAAVVNRMLQFVAKHAMLIQGGLPAYTDPRAR
jgi:hypothetical protein